LQRRQSPKEGISLKNKKEGKKTAKFDGHT